MSFSSRDQLITGMILIEAARDAQKEFDKNPPSLSRAEKEASNILRSFVDDAFEGLLFRAKTKLGSNFPACDVFGLVLHSPELPCAALLLSDHLNDEYGIFKFQVIVNTGIHKISNGCYYVKMAVRKIDIFAEFEKVEKNIKEEGDA